MNDTEEFKRKESEILRARAVSFTAFLLMSVARCGWADETSGCVCWGWVQATSSGGRRGTGASFCKLFILDHCRYHKWEKAILLQIFSSHVSEPFLLILVCATVRRRQFSGPGVDVLLSDIQVSLFPLSLCAPQPSILLQFFPFYLCIELIKIIC